MVSSAYLYSEKFSAIQTALLTLMATVRPKKPSLPGRFFHVLTYAEGLLANDAEQFQQELPVNDPEGCQHNQGEKDQH